MAAPALIIGSGVSGLTCVLAFIVDFGAAKAIRKSLKPPAQEPEPLALAPPETLERVAESA